VGEVTHVRSFTLVPDVAPRRTIAPAPNLYLLEVPGAVDAPEAEKSAMRGPAAPLKSSGALPLFPPLTVAISPLGVLAAFALTAASVPPAVFALGFNPSQSSAWRDKG
jgi:hypothetical protein